jgi:SAM-dependent methyltransferase
VSTPANAVRDTLPRRGAVPLVGERPTAPRPAAVGLPDYLVQTYRWAYLSESWRQVLDRPLVVSAILWGNAGRLMQSAVAEFTPGSDVLQTACVYGDFSQRLAGQIGHTGSLEVIDVAPLQVENCRRKLAAYSGARVRVADAAVPTGSLYDGICCFFLLHEVPEDYKRRIVDSLLASVRPGGRVVFVDYHRPRTLHPLRAVMSLVFRWLEPFAPSLWEREIASYARRPEGFVWHKETFFGGLYQKVVAIRAM